METYYEIKGRLHVGQNNWQLYSTSKDMAFVDILVTEALETGRYNSVRVYEVKKKCIREEIK